MSAAVVNLLDALERVLEATTPPDRPDVRFRFAEGPERPTGTSADRVLWFELPTEIATGAEAGADMTEMGWSFSIGLRLVQDGLSMRAQFNRIANEAVLIIRTIQNLSDLGDGVDGCLIDGAPNITTQDNSTVVRFALRATTQETD